MTSASISATMSPPALRATDLAVGYRTRGARRVVLEQINLDVRAGELVCLLGANGIGKSTLLRTLARLQPALEGSIEVGGTPLDSLSAADLARRVGVVLTERVVVESLPARRVVELGRYPHSGWLGRVSARDRAVVDWAIEAVNATHVADRDISRLSDGERQRIMVARALAQEPMLLVLDEPTAFLDFPSRTALMALLRDLTRARPIAVVVSTHEVELAWRTADVIWSMEDFEGERIMRSISTMRGDAGETSLAGGVRVSKGSLRVETYGTIDELNSSLGLARSICDDEAMAAFTKGVQQDLFKIGSSLATPPESPKPQIVIDQALVDRLTGEVHRIEAIEGMLADWSLPGEHRAAAAYDVARTICRRAERALVRLQESGTAVQPSILAYVNRLSDLLWLFGRKLEHDAGVSGSLREVTGKAGNRFSRAW
jgi:ATP:cob(I)alamin adenosyltransferase